jgi:hypothetical protein
MMEQSIIGVANVQSGTIDFFLEEGEMGTIALPPDLRVTGDPDAINHWACESGFMKIGEQIAVTDA